MANKQALRDLQTRLADRLQVARTQVRGQSWLAVESSGRGFLFPLQEAGEISVLTTITTVPYSHEWFLGVSNLRGHLHGVVDLAGFLGIKKIEVGRYQPHLVCFNQAFDLNCALMIDRLLGLRDEQALTPEAGDTVEYPAFVGARLRDAAGRVWQELRLSALANDEAFLKIVD
jgi:twitching motility protein PilI